LTLFSFFSQEVDECLADGSGVVDVAGNALAADASDAWAVDLTPPTGVAERVSPDPRNAAVASVRFTFSEPVTGLDLGDLSMRRNGAAVPLAGATLSTRDQVVWTLGNLSGLTGAEGAYSLALNAAGSGIRDMAGNPLQEAATTGWAADLTPPTVALSPVVPSPRVTPVSAIDLLFSEPVTGLDLADLSLKRDGTAIPLAGATLSRTGDSIWSLADLAALTAAPGHYTLAVNASGSGIRDAAGNGLLVDPAHSGAAAWTLAGSICSPAEASRIAFGSCTRNLRA
jgi:hypothetical protein